GSNTVGQLGNGTITSMSPYSIGHAVQALLPMPATAIALGYSHTCAIATNGELYCWGSNMSGQLGDPALSTTATPALISLAGSVVEIAGGGNFSCARKTNADIVCWGINASGQLGTGDMMDRTVPTPIIFGCQ